VRLSPNPVGDDHFPQGELYPILVNRAPDGRFHALSAECSHAGCVVESYDELEQGLRCPCHGSLYGFDGAVIQGPAARSLASYPVAYDGADSLEIQVPGYGFRITPQAAGSRIAPRMRLVFPSEANALYQVIRRTSLSDPGVPVKFSPLEEGAPDISTWIGTGGDQALYVSTAGAGGFFEVVMLLAEQ
jgi:nitrite reductase/ring-hydroxylating ferredoxin subunit